VDVQEFGSGKPVTSDQNHRLDPKLCTAAPSFDVHVGRFSAVG
jgi:hypothetical protein